ncbi:MAG: Hsp20/alpha crystallin family protein [Chloroflexota bacterium]
MTDMDSMSSTLKNLRASISRAINPDGTSGPLFDIYRTADAVVIESAPIDGLVAASIQVEMSGEELVISGQTEDTRTRPVTDFLHRERSFGSFSRTFVIGLPVEPERAGAKVRGSSLTVTLPLNTMTSQSDVIDVEIADE